MLARAHHRCERQLAIAAVAEQKQARDTSRFFCSAEASDQVEREILPRRRAACGDQLAAAAAVAQDPLRPEPDTWIAVTEQLRHGPVRGHVGSIEQAGFGQEHGATAGRAYERATINVSAHPRDLLRPPSFWRFIARQVNITDDDDVGVVAIQMAFGCYPQSGARPE